MQPEELIEDIARLLDEAREELAKAKTDLECEKRYELNKFLLSYTGDVSEKMVGSAVNHIHLTQLADQINDGWEPDWSNRVQKKYYLYFDKSVHDWAVGFNFYNIEKEHVFETEEKALLFRSEGSRLGLKYLRSEL